ncbi:MAG: polymorphic toxin-type HINT domain-containing protein [Micromonosporaceae bacterium]
MPDVAILNPCVDFLGADHHGTGYVQINADTMAVTNRRFDPFGRPRGTDVPWAGERGFVDGTLDTSTGLTHLGAREYDPGIGKFISVDPVIDPGDPQQLNAYANANNSPVTYSDPDGLRFAEDSDGKRTAVKNPSGGGYQFFGRVSQPSGTKHADGDDVQDAQKKLNDARKRQEALKRKLINAGKLFLDIILEVTGAKAGIDCFLKGDVGGCIETAVSVISGLVGGLLVKIGLKYALKWKAAAKLAMKVKKLVTDIADVIKNWSKAADEVADARRGLGAARAAGKGACSFSGDTKVRMAGGKTKPISKIKPGDKVYATDPQTGEKGTRTVTATWAHLDTLLDLKLAGGKRITTTENHPFWNATDRAWQRADQLDPGDKLTTANGRTLAVLGIDRESATVGFAYNLTIDDIHTYFVNGAGILVHNTCPIGGRDLDELSASGREIGRGGELTRAGLAYDKRMKKGQLPRVAGSQVDTVGQDLLDDILTHPQGVREQVRGGNFKGGSRFIRPDGVGAVFDTDGALHYFGLFRYP